MVTIIKSVLEEGSVHYQELQRLVENHEDRKDLGLEASKQIYKTAEKMFFALGLIEPEKCKTTLVNVGRKLGDFMDEVESLYSFKQINRDIASQELDATLQQVLEENSKI